MCKISDMETEKRVSHAAEGMRVLEQEDDAFATGTSNTFCVSYKSVASGANARADLMQLSNQR